MDFEKESNEEKWGPICPTYWYDSNEPATAPLFFY